MRFTVPHIKATVRDRKTNGAMPIMGSSATLVTSAITLELCFIPRRYSKLTKRLIYFLWRTTQ